MSTATVVRYRVSFTSDWHVGTGSGRSGDVDRLVARESDGFPFVPAKTLTGLWRDASERLAWALDSGVVGPWARFVEELWGSQPSLSAPRGFAPRAALVSVRPARHREGWRRAVQALNGGKVPAEVTVVRWSTAIDAESGRAQDATLRSVELGRALSELEGSITVSVMPNTTDIVLSFLRLAAAGVTSIGGHRRRGLGECNLILDRVPDDEDVHRLREAGLTPPKLTPTTERSSVAFVDASDDHSWCRLRLEFETVLPVVVPDRVEGNVVVSRDHPSGRHLLPAVCQIIDEAGVDSTLLVRQNALMVSDAHPVVAGRDTAPMPFAFSREKDPGLRRAVIFNTLKGYPTVQAKQMRGGWVAPDAGDGVLTQERVRMMSTTHSTILDSKQRPDESVGGVFTYQAIAPGQRFACEVMLRMDPSRIQHIAELFHGREHSIGTSRKDDYGVIRFVSVSEPEPVVSDMARSWHLGDTITVWCVSDVLLEDDLFSVRPDAEKMRSTIAAVLGVEPTALAVDPAQVRMRVRRHDGWHGRWRAPQPTQVAVQSGSVIVLEVIQPITSDRVAEATAIGIGERRAEGFGRILIDPPLLEPGTYETGLSSESISPPSAPSAPLVELSDNERHLLTLVEDDIWRSRIESAIDSHREQLARSLHLAKVGRTQLNHLRQLLLEGDGGGALTWLDRQRERKRWPEKAVNEMKKLLSEPQYLWNQLGFDEADRPSERLANTALVAMMERIVRVHTRHPQGGTDGSY